MFHIKLSPDRFPNLSEKRIEEMLRGHLDAARSITCEEDGDFVIEYEPADMDEFLSFQYPSVLQRLQKENNASLATAEALEIQARPTVVVNMFGGPGVGKTTAAHEVYADLAKLGYIVEYAPEYAKELSWAIDNPNCSESEQAAARQALDGSLANQKKIYIEQKARVDKLLGVVDFIVTDSPAILSCVYLKEVKNPQSNAFKRQAIDDFSRQTNFNMVVERGGAYTQKGRVHDEAAAKAVDTALEEFFQENGIYHGSYSHDKIEVAVKNMQKTLERARKSQDKALKDVDIDPKDLFPHPREFRRVADDEWRFVPEKGKASSPISVEMKRYDEDSSWTCSVNTGDSSRLAFGDTPEAAYQNALVPTSIRHKQQHHRDLIVADPDTGNAWMVKDLRIEDVENWTKRVFETHPPKTQEEEAAAKPIDKSKAPLTRKGNQR